MTKLSLRCDKCINREEILNTYRYVSKNKIIPSPSYQYSTYNSTKRDLWTQTLTF